MKRYDYIVIGAGTTGCVMASRLSENENTEVLLLEAGESFMGMPKPKVLRDSRLPVLTGFNWEFEANVHTSTMKSLSTEMQNAASVLAAASGRLGMLKASASNLLSGRNIVSKFNYPMARVVGGGSTINGAMSIVPPSTDFDEWSRSGVTGWGWNKVSPIFDNLLSTRQGTPILNIERDRKSDLFPVQREFYNAAAELGYPEADLTDATSAGVGIIPKNTRNGERESVDVSHLSAAMKRPNLTVLSHCVVERIICQNRMGNLTASAIETFVDGEAKSFFTNNVILSAGAVNSPAILMRSGIGDAKQLKEFGISPKLNLTGVGKNLVDHPSVSIWGVPKPGTNVIGEPIHQVMLRLGEASNEAVGSDLQLFMMGALQTKMFPPLDTLVNAETVDGISVMLGKPVSRGYIKLRGKSAKIPPSININCLDNRDDLERMKRGIRRAWEICQHPCLRKHIEKYVMWNSSIVQSDKLLQSMIQTTVRASMHPVGTLKMGADEDPDAVTDENGMLRGSDNITVADASIMPTITTVPPNMTCMVIGEKLASHLCNHL